MARNEPTKSPTNGAAAPAPPSPAEQAMEQVRELLFGQEKRSSDQRMSDLEAKMDAQFDALRRDMSERFTALENMIAELARDTDQKRLSSIDDIGSAIAAIGANVRKLGATRNGG